MTASVPPDREAWCDRCDWRWSGPVGDAQEAADGHGSRAGHNVTITRWVAPDREAAVQQVAEAMQYQFGGDHDYRDEAQLAADAFWPLICQAREDGERAGRETEREDYARRSLEARGITSTVVESDYDRGRREAAEAIEAHRDALPKTHSGLTGHYTNAARLARGAQQSDEKERTDGQ